MYCFKGKWLLQLELVAVSIGLAIPFLEWCFGHQMTAADFFQSCFFSFIYSNCVTFIMYVIVPPAWDRTSRFGLAPKWAVRVAVLSGGTAVGCLVAGLAPLALYPSSYNYWADFVQSFRLGLLITVLVTGFFTAYETLKYRLQATELELKIKEVERERALKLATEARLASLESRIHPHFLFNTINSVSSLIHEDPDRAEKLLTQMAALLRFSLDSAQTGLVPLERELKIVQDYLDIETARFNGRLRHSVTAPADLAGAVVPPLSIQTLVENSVKYAVSVRRQGATVRVSAARCEDGLRLEVADDGPGFVETELLAGHGLSNLRERLHALFGESADLSVSSAAGATSVRLLIPLVACNAAGNKAASHHAGV